jgi:hypothetical protein
MRMVMEDNFLSFPEQNTLINKIMMGIEDRRYVQKKFNPNYGVKKRTKQKSSGWLIFGIILFIFTTILIIQWL